MFKDLSLTLSTREREKEREREREREKRREERFLFSLIIIYQQNLIIGVLSHHVLLIIAMVTQFGMYFADT
jgi:hypothetical protein